MNKKLIALAVASACVAGEAMAQTANPVTLSGRLWAMFETVEAKGGAGAIDKRNRVSDYSSYLRVAGTEDLGGGLKAFFQLETGFPVDTTINSFATRNSAVGLQGGWGSVLLGRWDTPYKSLLTAVDPWADNALGDITGAGFDQGNNFSRRENNSVQYWSPNWGGFSARLQYSANETKGAFAVAGTTPPITLQANPRVYGAGVAYSGGNLYVAVAYEEHKDAYALVTGTGAAATANLGSEEGLGISASYKFGNLKVSGHYGKYEHDGRADDESFMVGVDWSIGKHSLVASYQEAEEGAAECDMGSIGWRYTFSRRTFFLISYTKVNNDNGMNCNFGANAIGAAGTNPQGISGGFQHVF